MRVAMNRIGLFTGLLAAFLATSAQAHPDPTVPVRAGSFMEMARISPDASLRVKSERAPTQELSENRKIAQLLSSPFDRQLGPMFGPPRQNFNSLSEPGEGDAREKRKIVEQL